MTISINKLLGIAPHAIENNTYSPSSLALKLTTSSTTDYTPENYEPLAENVPSKILVLCTEQANVPMTNGTYFSSGNHPVETFVPMLHLDNAGFECEIFTPTGKPVELEMWAMPDKDEQMQKIYQKYKSDLENPQSLAELVKRNFEDTQEYCAIFIPGGHGALLGLPEDKNVGKLINWVYQEDLFLLSICHGPAALLAAASDNESFAYTGYKIAAFPDSFDRLTPLIGYMPGQLTWFFGEKLKKQGMTITNKFADNSCYADRKLITGASPKAAQDFAKLAATTLVSSLNSRS
ncbi:MAG: DJ-1/PfpI family protein [Micrococcaceae bacterium]